MEQKDYIFEKLTPDNDVDISVYDEAIKKVQIMNIYLEMLRKYFLLHF